MKYIITESKLQKVINLILSEQETIDPKIQKFRDIMEKAGVSVGKGKPYFIMNELSFLFNLLNTPDPQQRIVKVNTRIKSKGNSELTQDEITTINNYFQENNERDIKKAMKKAENELEKFKKVAIANQKKGTFSYGTGEGNINTNTCKPGRICPEPDKVIGVPKTGGFSKKGL